MSAVRLILLPDGPLEVTGPVEIARQDGDPIDIPIVDCLPVPLRPLGKQAVLRRLACPDRLERGTGVSAME